MKSHGLLPGYMLSLQHEGSFMLDTTGFYIVWIPACAEMTRDTWMLVSGAHHSISRLQKEHRSNDAVPSSSASYGLQLLCFASRVPWRHFHSPFLVKCLNHIYTSDILVAS